MADTLVKVDNVSKKFCRDLKKSLWYGLKDLGGELICRSRINSEELRPAEFWAVKEVNFELKRGECLGLIGRNGAGKTTLLRMLNGLIKPDKGRIEMRGRVGALIALGAGFNPILTGRENIYVNAAVLGLSKKETDEKLADILNFAELGEFIDAPIQNYSSGMQVRLGFAIAVKTEPTILLLDEVLAVGDIGFQANCLNTLSEFRNKGVSFILVSHNMHHVARYSDQVLYLKRGQIAHFGDREAGIKEFLADMHETDVSLANERTDWSRVYGSGRIVFTGARFRNTDGQEVSTIDAGDAVTLEIDYERRAKLFEPPVLDVVVRDCEGLIYQGTNADNRQPFGELASRGQFHVHFDGIPVNSEYIDFFFCALDKRSAEVFDWKRNVRLSINRHATSQGKLYLRTLWKAD